MSLVAIIAPLAVFFSAPLSIFSINGWTLRNDEQYRVNRILICHGEPELHGNPCSPKKWLSLKCNDNLK